MRTPDPSPRPCPASNVDLFPDKVIGRRKGKIARSTSMIKVERGEKKKKKEEEKFARVTQPASQVNRERSGGEKLISTSCHLCRVA